MAPNFPLQVNTQSSRINPFLNATACESCSFCGSLSFPSIIGPFVAQPVKVKYVASNAINNVCFIVKSPIINVPSKTYNHVGLISGYFDILLCK